MALNARGYMPPSASDNWGTPIDLFNALHAEFDFTLDPCTTPANPLGCPRYYTVESNGLAQPWAPERVFMNPPYSDDDDWDG